MATKRILAVVDPRATDEQPVIERAAWLAQRAGAEIELFACYYDPDVDAARVATLWAPLPGARERLLAECRDRLEELAKPVRARGIAVTVDVAWDHPLGEAVVRKAAARPTWLVAKDTFHHNVIQRTLLSSTDWHLISHCAAPLLLVKQRKIANPPRVMVAVDPLHEHDKPAKLDDALFRYAGDLAKAADGELHVVHAVSMPMGLQLPPDVARGIVHEHGTAMTEFLRTHDVPRANVHTLMGLAHECVRDAATQQAADFVVMGAVARRGLRRVMIGSTADRVLDRLPCDLIIVKPAGFEASHGV